MTKARFNFTDGNNKDVKDSAPDWMDQLFESNIEKKEATIVKDLFATSNPQIKKCNMCGKILALNEIGKCSNCVQLHNK